MADEKKFDNTEKYIEIGYNVSYYRKHKGLTQEQLAEELGISRQHVGAIEAPNVDRKLSLDLLFNIATVLGIDSYRLLVFEKYDEILRKEKR